MRVLCLKLPSVHLELDDIFCVCVFVVVVVVVIVVVVVVVVFVCSPE